jgi:hypothetical protein
VQAGDWKNRPSEAFDDVGDGELARVDGELVAPNPPTTALDDAALLEVEQDD